MASLLGKTELTGVWKERFQDVEKLNEYSLKGLKTEINDAVIKDYALDGAVFKKNWGQTTNSFAKAKLQTKKR